MLLKLILSSLRTLLVLSLLAIALTGCSPSEHKGQSSMKNTPELLSNIINKGSDTIQLYIDQMVIINDSDKMERWWHVTLGKNSRKFAILEHYDNQRQHTLHFTQQGTYLLTVISKSDEKTLNQMQRQLTIIIK